MQCFALYAYPESHNAQRYRQTDGRHDDAKSRSHCVAVRSAKTHFRIAIWAITSTYR